MPLSKFFFRSRLSSVLDLSFMRSPPYLSLVSQALVSGGNSSCSARPLMGFRWVALLLHLLLF